MGNLFCCGEPRLDQMPHVTCYDGRSPFQSGCLGPGGLVQYSWTCFYQPWFAQVVCAILWGTLFLMLARRYYDSWCAKLESLLAVVDFARAN